MDELNTLRLWINQLDLRTGNGPIERPKTIATNCSGILSPFFLFANGNKIKPKYKQSLNWEYLYFSLKVGNINLRSILRTHVKEMQIIHHIGISNNKESDLYFLIAGTSDLDFLYPKIFKKSIYIPNKDHLYYDIGLDIPKSNILLPEFIEMFKELGDIK